MSDKAKNGSVVKIDYVGKLDDGTEFDSSKKEGAKPIEFTIGAGSVLPKFEAEIIGMAVGEKKSFSLEPIDAYGMPKEELHRPFPRDKIPSGQEVKVGMAIVLQSPDGQQIPVLIKEVRETEIILDMNHPLAGKKLNFEIELVSVEEAKEAPAEKSEAPVEEKKETAEIKEAPAEKTEAPTEEKKETTETKDAPAEKTEAPTEEKKEEPKAEEKKE